MAQELLFGDLANGNDDMSRSYTIQDANGASVGQKSSLISLSRVPSAPGLLKDHQKWVEIIVDVHMCKVEVSYGQRDL